MEKQTLIDLINRVLLGIGEAPLEDDTVIDTLPLGTDAETAKRKVRESIRAVLTQGWFFNMDYDIDLVPDIDGFITLPPNVLRVDFGNTEFKYQYVMKNHKIYDVRNHTYVIDKTLTADLIYLVPIEDLPIEAYEYIAERATRVFQEQVIGSVEATQITRLNEASSLVDLQRLQLQSQDYGLIRGSRIHNGYLKKYLYKNKGRRS